MFEQTDGVPRWGVAQIFSNRAHRIREEIERLGRGTFQPTFARRWISDGKISCRERELLPGYLIFETSGEDWAGLGDIEGVIRILRSSRGISSPVHQVEMYRLVIEHAIGTHNQIQAEVRQKEGKRRHRKPRPSKRARMRESRVAA